MTDEQALKQKREPIKNVEVINALKTAMMPQIDAALTQFFGAMTETMEVVSATEIDRCISIVESCSHAENPAWNKAINFAASALRDWKKEMQHDR